MSKNKSNWIDIRHFNLKNQLQLTCASERIKAFITDMFMINMPLLYLTTYIFLDGKESFIHNQSVIFICGMGYGVITSLFFALTSQTPGYKYMQIKLVRCSAQNNDKKKDKIFKIGFFRAFFRYILWIIGTSFLFGIIVSILRTDGKCLHDIICQTHVVCVKE